MGCIYRRNKTYWVKYYRNGKPYQESTHSDKKEVAKRLLQNREAEIAQGKLPGICFERVSFDELADDYLTDYRINVRSSIAKAERSIKHLKKEFGNLRAPAITTPMIKKYIEKRMESKMTNASINRELSALKRMYRLASRCTPPKVSHVPYMPMLKENNIRTGFFEHGEYLAVLKYLPEHMKPVARFAYSTGWRRGEILSLTWRQVDLQEGTVRLEPGQTKNDEGRTLYLEPELLDMLKDLFKRRLLGCPYVFHRKGRRITEFRKSWDSACEKAKVPGKIFHDFRRTAVRNMVRAGIPERVAMMVSGHKTRSVFDRYNIVSREDLMEAAIKRQNFREENSARLQNGYNHPSNEKRVVDIKSATL